MLGTNIPLSNVAGHLTRVLKNSNAGLHLADGFRDMWDVLMQHAEIYCFGVCRSEGFSFCDGVDSKQQSVISACELVTSSGPNADPWGTPLPIFWELERKQPATTLHTFP